MSRVGSCTRGPGEACNGTAVGRTQAQSGRRVIEQCSIVSRFKDFLEAKKYQPLGLAVICAAIGVPERKLRACCQEQLSTSPTQYLRLRRMYLARQSLQTADPSTRTVTEIATEYGFVELGRFSVDYRSLFGESPSVTLRRE